MSILTSDTFTEGSDTALTSHTMDTGGGSWAVEAAQFTAIAATDDCRHNGGSLNRARVSVDHGADDMNVEASVKVGPSTARQCGVCARMTTADYANQYEAYIQGTAGGTTVDVFLFKNVGGVRTELNTSNETLASGTYATLRLEVSAGSQIVKLNGATVITGTEADATLSGQNYVGIIMKGVGETTTRLDNFQSEDVAVGGASAVGTVFQSPVISNEHNRNRTILALLLSSFFKKVMRRCHK